MSSTPTIFDASRPNRNDDDKAYSASGARLTAIQLAQYYALSFLAERGELTTSRERIAASQKQHDATASSC
jgi:hypothetical protein